MMLLENGFLGGFGSYFNNDFCLFLTPVTYEWNIFFHWTMIITAHEALYFGIQAKQTLKGKSMAH